MKVPKHPAPVSPKKQPTKRGPRRWTSSKPAEIIESVARERELLDLIARNRPIEVIGIVDHLGAVHGVPKYKDSRSMLLIHSDVFTTAHRRWRYRVDTGKMSVLPGCEDDEHYKLNAEEQHHVNEFLSRRGWL